MLSNCGAGGLQEEVSVAGGDVGHNASAAAFVYSGLLSPRHAVVFPNQGQNHLSNRLQLEDRLERLLPRSLLEP